MVICLGIESTAHTFGVGIVDDKGNVLADTRDTLTTEKGGIIPAQAQRHHLELKDKLLNKAMNDSKLTFDDIDVLCLAGGFGNYIDTDNAIAIGMLPWEMKNKIISLGNTSGTGALLSLKSVAFDDMITKILAKTVYVELSNEEDFTLDFVMNMGFDV